jgi:allantoinase
VDLVDRGVGHERGGTHARVDVSAETCPHYLLLNNTDVKAIGVLAKCLPPIRPEAARQQLWTELRAGRIQTIGSAHAPYPPEMKAGTDFFAAPDGLAGGQHGFELLANACVDTWPADLPRLAALCARNVARRFRLDDRKGTLAEGFDADFCLVQAAPVRTIATDELWTRHRVSPYAGRRSRVRISHTYLRGRAIWADGRLTNQFQHGQFLKPTR